MASSCPRPPFQLIEQERAQPPPAVKRVNCKVGDVNLPLHLPHSPVTEDALASNQNQVMGMLVPRKLAFKGKPGPGCGKGHLLDGHNLIEVG